MSFFKPHKSKKMKKMDASLPEHLEEGETILATVYGAYASTILGQAALRQGMLAATDRRLVFFALRLNGYDLESFPYENISSFEQGKRAMGHTFRFIASGNTVALKYVNLGDLEGFTREVKARIAKLGSAPEPEATAPGSVVEQIRRFAELRDEGIISAEEFEQQKHKLLQLQ